MDLPQIEYLNKAFQRGKLAHAYLFYGSGAPLMLKAAKDFAASLPNSEIIVLGATSTLKDKRKDIPIEDIRALKRRMSLAPAGGVRRIAIINEAERLSREAADAFLKLLEEPGAGVLFLLITAARDLVPQTVVSRAVPLRFPAARIRSLAEHEKDPFFGRLLTLLGENRVFELLRLSSEAAEDKPLRDKVLLHLMIILRQEVLSGKSNAANAIEKIKFANRAAEWLETTNVNPRLVLDALFLK